MDSQTIIFSILSGLIIYIIIELDKKYFSKEENKTYSSLRIATAIAVIVYIVITFFKCSIKCEKPVKVNVINSPVSVERQQILTDQF